MSKKRIIRVPDCANYAAIFIQGPNPQPLSRETASELLLSKNPVVRLCGRQVVILVRSNGEREECCVEVLKPNRRQHQDCIVSGSARMGPPVVIQSRSNSRRGRGRRVRGGDWRKNAYENILTAEHLTIPEEIQTPRYRTADGTDLGVSKAMLLSTSERSILYFPNA